MKGSVFLFFFKNVKFVVPYSIYEHQKPPFYSASCMYSKKFIFRILAQTTSKKLRHLLKAKSEACCCFLNSAAAKLPLHFVTLSELWPRIYAGESTFQKCKII